MTIQRCPHCKEIDWSRYRTIYDTLQWMKSQETVTARIMADNIGVSIQVASNRLALLAKEGFTEGTERNLPNGGRETVWTLLANVP